ncbi:aminopeptidase N [Dactylosporangium matsuzakiense]|uniref:Aminopeptidase N n=1 Tax=Dactylosporangium matsuzakiense TaxID=53360 RepID=A0A9W6NKM5_9ACTN|nr:aminopeptidase N [Dactylosporangium matsuzakiense]UWZ46102.1 aminopeptidase N [Dactylosporangium matsuzakiense]GLL00238.1 aminopeptidase [Dactylosporangium matsuzakiense]
MSSLTRREAVERARLVAVRSYVIELDLTAADSFTSRTVVEFSCTEPGAESFAELKGAQTAHVTLNGAEVPIVDGRVKLAGLAAENRLEARFTARYSPSGEGILRFVDPEDGQTYLYGQAPLDDAQRMFVCFDQPDLKAPMTLTVHAPEEWTVRGNAAVARRDGGRWEFAQTPPLSTYLFSFIAGPWHRLEREHDGIALGLLCRRSLAAGLDADADALFAATAAAFDRYHELFGVRYPFGKYDQAFVPGFAGGAVENPALVNYREEFLFRAGATDSDRHRRFVVMAHEMAHMWFGNLVTLRWWDDVWLNEAFAELMGWRVAGETGRHPAAAADFAIWRERWGYLADERPSTHPVAPDGIADTAVAFQNFDGISYAKGAAALRQLAVHLGDEVFLSGLREYFRRYRFGNAALTDFLAVIGDAAGRDLTGWAELWLRSTGANTLRPLPARAAGGPAGLTVEQSGRPLRPHRLTVSAFASDGSVLRVPFTIDAAATTVPGIAAAPAGTVLLLNDGDDTYAKVRFDPFSRAALPAVLPDLEDPLARAVIWASVMDAVRDGGEIPPSEFLALLVAALPAERQEGIFEEVLTFARESLARRGLIPFGPLAEVCTAALAAAAPGSGRQLATARALAGVAGVPLLRSWLGDDAPEGLVIDADLRWSLLLRLAALGSADPDEIAAEERRDPSSTGAERAAACRAAFPSAEAKAAAWEALVHDSNPRLAIANAEAFWQAGQEALTDGYAERYFTDVPAMLEGRYLPAALKVVRFAFPVYSPRALASADALLRTDLDPLLRREIADGADELRRWT